VHSTLIGRGGATYRGERDVDRKDVLLYAAALLVLTFLIAASLHLLHVTNNWATNTLMFIPGLLALGFRLRRKEGFRSVGWKTGPFAYWLWALLLPIIVIVISLPISIRLGFAALAPASTAMGHLASQPIKILENVLIYTVISIPFALGEEFGWRGYAQSKFVQEFGLIKGLLLLGLIWGFWHTPIYFFMGNYPDHSFLGPFVMTPIDNILATVPLAWLYLKSRSIWVPVLVHAFADVLWGFSGLLFPPTHEIQSWAILQAVQLIISIALLVDLRSGQGRASEYSLVDSALPSR
jgi:membrane protease YdiL (CAAX protease family)